VTCKKRDCQPHERHRASGTTSPRDFRCPQSHAVQQSDDSHPRTRRRRGLSLGVDDVVHQGLPRHMTPSTRSPMQASKAMTTTPQNEDGGGCPVVGEVDPQPAPQTTGRPRPFTRLHLPRQHTSSTVKPTTATSLGARRSLGVDDVAHQGLPRLATSGTRILTQASKAIPPHPKPRRRRGLSRR